jgi:hypothetical protein
MWLNYRANQEHIAAVEVQKLIDDSNKALDNTKRLAPTDRDAAREAAQNAMASAQKARDRDPKNQAANKAYNDAADWLDQFNGVAVLFTISSFATFSDEGAKPARIVTHYPDVFILDKGTQRIYRYAVTETVPSATPVGTDGIILKAGDKVDNRTVAQLIDMTWIESGRLVALERSGVFMQYDPARLQWSARSATDAAAWTRVNLAASYGTNLYLADAPLNQILKYVANNEGWWTSAVTYFMPGVNPDLSNLVDMTLDENVWLLRDNGSILRYMSGRPNDLQLRDLDKPLSQPVAIFTSDRIGNLYIADAGNQRVVQVDKTTGRFVRQFKPSAQNRDVFKSLKTLTVDEANRKFYFINGNQARLATIPQ